MSSKPASGSKESVNRASNAICIALGCVLIALGIVYCLGCVVFYQRFWPNTSIGGSNVSFLSTASAEEVLDEASTAKTVTVSGQGVNFTLTSSNAGLELNVDTAVTAGLEKVDSWQWPVQLFGEHDYSDVLVTSFDSSLLRDTVEAQLSSFNSMADDPVDAFLYFDKATNSLKVNPGSLGTKLDVDSVTTTIAEALAKGSDHAALTSANLVQQTVKADDPNLIAQMNTANNEIFGCNIDLMVAGTAVATISSATVNEWLSYGDDGTVWLDESKVAAWCNAIETIVDSAGTTRTYTRPYDLKQVTVSGGSYGWISNGDELYSLVLDCIYNKYTGQYDIPMKQTAEVYNPGGNDWGTRWVDVDLTEQYARFYDSDGSIAMETPIISGTDAVEGRTTPTGVYYITNKARNQTLKGLPDENGNPLYETFVSYWMPFVENMVGLHDADWQDWTQDYYSLSQVYHTLLGSHGCVNLPPSVAAWAWDYLSVGDVVITHY